MTRHRSSIRPSLEALEARDNPAAAVGGTVTATFAAGRLTVTGDAAANALYVTQGADGRLILSGNGSGTVIRLNGGPDDGTVTLPAPVTGGVTIALGDGSDDLFIDGVQLPGALTINGGNGSAAGPAGNLVRLRDVHVGGKLGITNVAGADVTYLWGAIDVRGGLAIQNGPGGSEVWGDATTDLRVGGVLTVANGAGYDQTELGNVANVAVGGLVVNNGNDADGSYLRVHPNGDLTVAGGVRVTNGAGYDFTDLGGQNAVIRGAVAIRNGDGGSFNTLLALGTVYARSVSIVNGTGEDHNEIVTYDAAVVYGPVRFVNGDGRSGNYVGGGNALAVVGGVTFVNGAGYDVNTVFSNDCRIGVGVTVRNGDGDSDTSIGGEVNLMVEGPTRVTAGTGYDLVTVGAGRVLGTIPAVDVGGVRVNVGDGGSDVQVRGGRLAVHGPLSVTGWDGTDRVLVSTESANGSIAGTLAIDIGAGDEQWVNLTAATGRVLTVGALGIWTDNPVGWNWIDLTAVDVRTWTEIWTGDGQEQVRVTGSTFRGTFDLDTAGGDDVVWIEWAGGSTTFKGRAWFDTGDGDDRLWVLGGPNGAGWVEFGSASRWDGGGGTGDVLAAVDNGNLVYWKVPAVSGFEATP